MKHITCYLTQMREKRCKEFCNVGIKDKKSNHTAGESL